MRTAPLPDGHVEPGRPPQAPPAGVDKKAPPAGVDKPPPSRPAGPPPTRNLSRPVNLESTPRALPCVKRPAGQPDRAYLGDDEPGGDAGHEDGGEGEVAHAEQFGGGGPDAECADEGGEQRTYRWDNVVDLLQSKLQAPPTRR